MADKVVDNHSYDDTKFAGLISSIQVPGVALAYQIHDPDALHDISDLGLDSAIVFGGVVANESELPSTGVTQGTVYYIQENDREVIWVIEDGVGRWEDFGQGVSLDHTHSVTSTGQNSMSGTNSLSGSATVTGTNAASAVTGSVTVPTVAEEAVYIKATSSAPTVTAPTDKAIVGFGAHTTAAAITALNTTTIKNPTATDVSIPNVTGNTPVTASKVDVVEVEASKITANEDVTASHITNNATVTASKVTTSDVSIPNVTKNDAVTASKISANTSVTASKVTTEDVTAHQVVTGTKAYWSASVTNGCLSFSFVANNPSTGTAVTCSKVRATDVVASKITASDVSASKVTLGTALSASKVTASDVVASKVTASEVKASKITAEDVAASAVTAEDVAASKVTLGTALAASKVTTSNVTVATGSKTTANAITALGTATTKDFATNVSVAAPTITLAPADADTGVHTGDNVTIGSRTASVSGTAAAQTWTQKSGTASVSGNVTVSACA